MRYRSDHFEQGSMSIVKYEVYFQTLSRYLVASISTNPNWIQKFLKGLDGIYKLVTTKMVVLVASF